MKVRIKENSWVAKMAAAKLKSDKVAIVFGHTIHLHNTTRQEFLMNTEWVCHELQHVNQYRRHGFAGFLGKYLLESLKKGYHHNRFEKEARENESNTGLLKEVEFI